MNRLTTAITAILLLGLLSQGCVSQKTYDSTLDDLAHSQDELQSAQASLSDAQAYIEKLKHQRFRADERLATCERSIRDSIRENREVGRLLKGCRANLIEATKELHAANNRNESAQKKSAKQHEEMVAQRNKLLEQLSELKAENRKKQRLYKQMRDELQSLIDAGQLDVTLKNGRLVINLPQDILFESGRADVGKTGQEALHTVASVLSQFPNRRFQVEGYTDDVPISTSKFPSNWELSTARAIAVLHILQDGGVPPQNLSAAGYGKYHPVVPNDSPEHRAKNRRIEIVVLPNLDALRHIAK